MSRSQNLANASPTLDLWSLDEPDIVLSVSQINEHKFLFQLDQKVWFKGFECIIKGAGFDPKRKKLMYELSIELMSKTVKRKKLMYEYSIELTSKTVWIEVDDIECK